MLRCMTCNINPYRHIMKLHSFIEQIVSPPCKCCLFSALQATLADRRTPDAAALAVYDSAVQVQDKVDQHRCLYLHACVAILKPMAFFRSNGCSSAWRQ